MLARKKSGFTLIELLVVIAIIAILAAILFPVFAKAREAARKATCQSNMKQCAQSLKMYTDDYDGTLPSSMLNNPATGTSAQETSDFLTKLSISGATAFPPSIAGRWTWPQVLYDNMRNKDVMFCPSDSVERTPTSSLLPIVSYWMKPAIDAAWLNLARKKMADYGYESDQIAFFEYRGWHFGDQSGLKQGVQINASFMDSHVEPINLPKDASAPTNAINSDGNNITVGGTATPMAYPTASFFFEPFYYNTNVDANNISKTAGRDGVSATLDVNVGGKYMDPTANYDVL